MTAELLSAYGQNWITKPNWWDDEHYPCESLHIPDMGTYIKLSVFVMEILEIPLKWIYKVEVNSETKYLDIILDKYALDTKKLTATIVMCDNRWGPCLVGLYSEYLDDCYNSEKTFLKISIKL